MRKFIVLCLPLMLAGCGSVSGSGGPFVDQKVIRDKTVFVARIADPISTDEEIILGSGNAASAAVAESLREHGVRVTRFPNDDNSGYTLTTAITHWEHHATEWNFVPDVVAMSMRLVDDKSGAIVAVANSKVVGSSIQFFPQEVDRLLPDAVEDSVTRLYGPRP